MSAGICADGVSIYQQRLQKLLIPFESPIQTVSERVNLTQKWAMNLSKFHRGTLNITVNEWQYRSIARDHSRLTLQN